MKGRMRRGAVIAGVIASLLVGVLSIQVAADLAAAAAPPPAPPVSLDTLKSQLAAEQDRATGLQQQLEDLMGVTGQLTDALDATQTQVNDDGLSATDLRHRLKAAEAKLALVNGLLRKAKARLVALGQTTAGLSAGSGSSSGKGGGGGGAGAAATPAPTAPPPAAPTFSLSLSLAGGGVKAAWTACTLNNFYAYALVRSTDREIHYPPEDRDTLVAQVNSSSTLTATDGAAPSGTLWYRLYCLTRSGGETRIGTSTSTVQISVP